MKNKKNVLQSNEYSENMLMCLGLTSNICFNSSSLICHKKKGIGYLELSIWISLQRAEQLKTCYIRKFVNIKKNSKTEWIKLKYPISSSQISFWH